MTRLRACIVLSALGCLAASARSAEDAATCGDDGRAYQRLAARDLEAGDPQRATERLTLAQDDGCVSSELSHRLGLAWQREGRFEDALTAFDTAQRNAPDQADQALSVGRYAEVLAQLGSREQALDLVQFARRLHPEPPAWMNDLALSLDRQLAAEPFTRERVTRSFSTSTMGRLSPQTLAPVAAVAALATIPPATRSLPFRVHFALNSAAIDPADRREVVELASGLASDALAGQRFLLVGHTDERGSAAYNLLLSQQRAESVFRMVAELEPQLAPRLRYLGMGEQEPLYRDAQTEEQHRLNRRVQVMIDDS